ncbi:MAG: helix-turn-helix domain-containing protein, partial [Actinomycetota bacterium]|nr:helix-turn-helix domain-containing protein [Actinomycetota bacterium]
MSIAAAPGHASTDPEVARREWKAEATRRIEAAGDELAAAVAALAALDEADEASISRGRSGFPPALMTMREAARHLAVGQTTLNRLVQTGEIASVLIGHSRRVPVAAIGAYLQTRQAAAYDRT